jgi:DNA-binding response OmpR family regulator
MPHILVVDDEAPIRETLKEILEYEQFEVRHSSSVFDGDYFLLFY